ncbi:MAG: trigger factor [Planctomycetota bacterium]|nr:MAG: trigger factor [Planctomycetota bacterium]
MADQQVLDETQAEIADGRPRLDLKTEMKDIGPCKKHVRVTVSKDSVAAVVADALKVYSAKAEVPGFRTGKVPTSLVKKRFKKEISEEVKQRVLMASLDQIANDSKIDPINEPQFDMSTVEIPEDGDFEYEFDVEVRPTFDLPEYKNLKINRPVREISEQDIDDYQADFVEGYGILEPVDGAVSAGDYVNVDIVIKRNGVEYNKINDQLIRVRSVLKFQDAQLSDFDKLVTGAQADDVRQTQITVSMEAPTVELRGESLDIELTILDVKRLAAPTVDESFCDRVGFSSVESLRTAIRRTLDRQVKYEQRQQCRTQVMAKITESANWELPEDLVAKQVDNALRREILEMRQAGFTPQDILSRENELRQQSLSMTRRNLKEHFVLDRIATDEKVDVSELEIEQEITAMAFQQGESPRRVRARLIKSGMIENLYAQIRERKAVDLILSTAQFNDTQYQLKQDRTTAALNKSICVTAVAPAEPNEDSEGDDE